MYDRPTMIRKEGGGWVICRRRSAVGMDICILMLRNLLLRTTLSREQVLFTLSCAFHFAYCTIHTVGPPVVG